MKMDELKQLSPEELEDKLYSLKKELYDLRFQAKCAKIEKSSRIGQVKHDIARILTLKRQEELARGAKKPFEEAKANEGARTQEKENRGSLKR